MSVLESLGMLKIDFLGLRNLTIIENCLKRIGADRPDMNSIPTDDAEVFRMMSEGSTSAVFQFESHGMRALIMKLKPSSMK